MTANMPLRDRVFCRDVSSAAEPSVAYDEAWAGGSERRGGSRASGSSGAGFAAGASARVLALAGRGLGNIPELGGCQGGPPVWKPGKMFDDRHSSGGG